MLKRELAKRVTLTMRPGALRKAQQLAGILDTDLSGLISQLIVQEWERRHGPIKAEEVLEKLTK